MSDPRTNAALLDTVVLARWREQAEQRIRRAPLLVDSAERPWRAIARPAQLAPEEGEWFREWYVRGSRRSGKTWTGGNQFADLILANGPNEWAVVAPTFADARDTCMESMRSGLLKALTARVGPGGQLLDKGPYVSGWNRSMGQLYLQNGSVVFCDGADDGALRIQGKGLAGAWCDEIGLWRQWKTAYDESLRYAVSSSPAKLVLTGTPKMFMPARVLVRRLLNDPKVAKSWLKIEANRANLSADAVDEIMSLAGTRLGRQEALGELVEDAEGSLWTWEVLDACRIDTVPDGVDFVRVVIAIDPATSVGETSDETGIMVVALGSDGHGYVLADLSGRFSPQGWGQRVVEAYHRFRADLIIGEVNNGGDMVGHVVHTVTSDVGYRAIRATRGKLLRAEPVAAAYEGPIEDEVRRPGRVHHVGPAGTFATLELQMAQCIPGQDQDHDDRLDACVYGLTELGLVGAGMSWDDVYQASAGEQKATVKAEEENPWDEVYGDMRGQNVADSFRT